MFVIDEWVLLGKNLTFWYSVSTWGAWRTAMEPVLEGCGRGDRRWAKHSACTTGKTQEKFLLLPLLFLIIDMLTLLSFLRSSCWDWLVISPPNRMLLNAAAFWNRISSSLKKKKKSGWSQSVLHDPSCFNQYANNTCLFSFSVFALHSYPWAGGKGLFFSRQKWGKQICSWDHRGRRVDSCPESDEQPLLLFIHPSIHLSMRP